MTIKIAALILALFLTMQSNESKAGEDLEANLKAFARLVGYFNYNTYDGNFPFLGFNAYKVPFDRGSFVVVAAHHIPGQFEKLGAVQIAAVTSPETSR